MCIIDINKIYCYFVVYMETTTIQEWDQLQLKEDLLRGIYAYGFEKPSTIQKEAIEPIIRGSDLIAQAQSGSGKTGSFCISTLQKVDTEINEIQALILSPTRELAIQSKQVMQDIGRNMSKLNVKTFVGGSPIRDDIRILKSRNQPHVILGTIGRILDMFQRRLIDGNTIKILIIDEADEMLSRGFHDKMRELFENYFTSELQVVLFSATMPNDIISLTNKFMNNPERILVKKEELSLKCIQQYFVAVLNDEMKYNKLKELFSVISISKCIIYCNTVQRVIDLYEAMKRDGYSICCIHSNMEKEDRNKTLHTFRYSDERILISSDITARGIDIQQVSTVLNFDLTRNVHTYLHRIGRGGRWGRKGVAINFITRQDVMDIKKIERHYQVDIQELPMNFSGM